MKTRWAAAVCAWLICSTRLCSDRTIENACREKNMIAHALFNSDPLEPTACTPSMRRPPKQIAPFVADTAVLLNQGIGGRRTVMFEGAQATMLDIDHGTYPFVTSSSCTAAAQPPGQVFRAAALYRELYAAAPSLQFATAYRRLTGAAPTCRRRAAATAGSGGHRRPGGPRPPVHPRRAARSCCPRASLSGLGGRVCAGPR